MIFNSSFDFTDHYRAIERAPIENINDELDYRAQIISSETIHPGCEHSIISFEKINVKKLLTVHRYLEFKEGLYHYEPYFKNTPKPACDKTQRWVSLTNATLRKLLNGIDKKTTFATPRYAYYHRKYSKIEFSEGDISSFIGRLYNKNSVINFSKELRYYLFKDEYIDFDIVNSHPTLCHIYCLENSLQCKALAEYVSNRDAVLEKIGNELTESKKEYDSVKHRIILQMNRTWSKIPTGSKTLDELDADFTLVREHLWSAFLGGKMDKYKPAVSLKHYNKKKLEKKNIRTKEDKIRLKKVILQSFYFSDKETANLRRLSAFLRSQYKKHLRDNDIKFLSELIPITDKTVDLPASNTLYTIPFYDGFYIASECKDFQEKVPDLLEYYHHQYSKHVRFEQKEITCPTETMFCNSTEFKRFEIINSWLSTPNNSKLMYKLLRITGGYPRLHQLESTSFEQLKAIFTEVKLMQYMYLLRRDFTCESDITNIINKNYIDWQHKQRGTPSKK